MSAPRHDGRKPTAATLALAALVAAAALPAAAQMSSSDAGAGSPAPTVQALDLTAAVRLAREHNPQVAEADANTDAAHAAKREAQLGRLPSVVARETAVRTTSPADVFGLELMQERFSFPAFTQSDPNTPDPLNNYTSEIEVSVPLFTGGALSAGIRQAGRMADAADAVRAHTARAVDLGVTQAYLGALLAGHFAELAEEARATVAKHVEQAQSFFDAGMIVESDLLQARVQLARMDEGLVRARNGERMARAALNRAMGVDQGQEFALSEAPEAAAPRAATLEEALALARANRADLRASDRRVEAMKAGIARAQAEYFPRIGVAARWDWNDDNVFGTAGDSYTLVGRAEWNVWNWGQTSARVAQSKGAYRAADEARRSYADQVELEVRGAWQAVEEARARRAATEGAVAAAERAHSILEDRFTQGVAKVTDLLDAETMAHEQRVRDVQARFDLQQALRTLSFAIGDDPVAEVKP
ncbi:MAG: TolC family protein [bacterium]